MQLDRKKVRLPRVERTEDVHPDDSENLLWAVSYSDLLMVLMSFFVIFFAANKNKKDAIFKEVSVALNKNDPNAEALGTGAGGPDVPTVQDGKAITRAQFEQFQQQMAEAEKVHYEVKKAVAGELETLGVEIDTTEEPTAMTVNLPDNIYPKTFYTVTPKIQLMLDQIFKVIEPYKEKVNVHFVGHSDSTPIKVDGGNVAFVTSNYTLSALRASKALEYSLSLGYPSQQLFAQGGAENMRDSRSLSVRLVMKSVNVKKDDVAH